MWCSQLNLLFGQLKSNAFFHSLSSFTLTLFQISFILSQIKGYNGCIIINIRTEGDTSWWLWYTVCRCRRLYVQASFPFESRQLSFSEIQTALENLANLPNFTAKLCKNPLNTSKILKLKFYLILECLNSMLKQFWAQSEVLGVKSKPFSKIWQIYLVCQIYFRKTKMEVSYSSLICQAT